MEKLLLNSSFSGNENYFPGNFLLENNCEKSVIERMRYSRKKLQCAGQESFLTGAYVV